MTVENKLWWREFLARAGLNVLIALSQFAMGFVFAYSVLFGVAGIVIGSIAMVAIGALGVFGMVRLMLNPLPAWARPSRSSYIPQLAKEHGYDTPLQWLRERDLSEQDYTALIVWAFKTGEQEVVAYLLDSRKILGMWFNGELWYAHAIPSLDSLSLSMRKLCILKGYERNELFRLFVVKESFWPQLNSEIHTIISEKAKTSPIGEGLKMLKEDQGDSVLRERMKSFNEIIKKVNEEHAASCLKDLQDFHPGMRDPASIIFAYCYDNSESADLATAKVDKYNSSADDNLEYYRHLFDA